MYKSSLISCVELLYEERIITSNKKKHLIEGIKNNDKRAYNEVTHELRKLSQKALKEGK